MLYHLIPPCWVHHNNYSMHMMLDTTDDTPCTQYASCHHRIRNKRGDLRSSCHTKDTVQ